MTTRTHHLPDGRMLMIREAVPDDARALLDYIAAVGGESDFLTFGAGEFELTEEQEKEVLKRFNDADNELYIIGLIDDDIVSALSFSAGRRARVRHAGEFGMTVRKEYWGLGIGALMLDTLIDWGPTTGIISKINLKVRTDNERAVRLYKRKGFVIEGTISRGIFLDGRYFDHYWMGLEV
jgi:RimJ/RimL family protein N-acetyltransferase